MGAQQLWGRKGDRQHRLALVIASDGDLPLDGAGRREDLWRCHSSLSRRHGCQQLFKLVADLVGANRSEHGDDPIATTNVVCVKLWQQRTTEGCDRFLGSRWGQVKRMDGGKQGTSQFFECNLNQLILLSLDAGDQCFLLAVDFLLRERRV